MKLIITFSLLLVSLSSFAGDQYGKIVGYVPYHSGGVKHFAFKLENNIVEGCNTSGRFYIDESNLSYNEVVSSLIAAFHSKTDVKVNYSTTCNVWSNSYDANYVCIGGINC